MNREEREALKMSAAHQAARRVEDALDRHGIAGEAETHAGYISLELDIVSANALADWLNRVADKQRPGIDVPDLFQR